MKQDKNLIDTMKILQNVCYANFVGGLISESTGNISLAKKCLNYIMKNNKSRWDFRDDIKVNYEAWLSVAGRFLNGICSIMTIMHKITPSKT